MGNIKSVLLVIPMLFLFFVYSPIYAADESVNYTYDALDRLVGVEYVGRGSISYTYDQAGDIINLTILVVNSTFIDTDQDGIEDDWEMTFWGDLTTASAMTDFDDDGYSDLWEYLNWKEYVFDEDGVVYSPLFINASGGRGYGSGGAFWIMMLPAILGTSGQ